MQNESLENLKKIIHENSSGVLAMQHYCRSLWYHPMIKKIRKDLSNQIWWDRLLVHHMHLPTIQISDACTGYKVNVFFQKSDIWGSDGVDHLGDCVTCHDIMWYLAVSQYLRMKPWRFSLKMFGRQNVGSHFVFLSDHLTQALLVDLHYTTETTLFFSEVST